LQQWKVSETVDFQKIGDLVGELLTRCAGGVEEELHVGALIAVDELQDGAEVGDGLEAKLLSLKRVFLD
jgi:hypothetical protein